MLVRSSWSRFGHRSMLWEPDLIVANLAASLGAVQQLSNSLEPVIVLAERFNSPSLVPSGCPRALADRRRQLGRDRAGALNGTGGLALRGIFQLNLLLDLRFDRASSLSGWVSQKERAEVASRGSNKAISSIASWCPRFYTRRRPGRLPRKTSALRSIKQPLG